MQLPSSSTTLALLFTALSLQGCPREGQGNRKPLSTASNCTWAGNDAHHIDLIRRGNSFVLNSFVCGGDARYTAQQLGHHQDIVNAFTFTLTENASPADCKDLLAQMANKLTDEKLKSGKDSWFGHSKPVDWQDVSQTLCLLAESAVPNHQQAQQQGTAGPNPGSNQQALTSRVPAPAPIPQPPGGMQQTMPDVQQMQAIAPPVEPQPQAQSSPIVPAPTATAQQGAPAVQRTVIAGQPANGVGQQQLPQGVDQSALAVVGGQRTR